MQWNILRVVYYIPLLFLYKVLCPAAKIDPQENLSLLAGFEGIQLFSDREGKAPCYKS